MGGKPNTNRKLRRSRRLMGLGPPNIRPVKRVTAPRGHRHRCPSGNDCSSMNQTSETTENVMKQTTETTGNVCDSLRLNSGGQGTREYALLEGGTGMVCSQTVVVSPPSRSKCATSRKNSSVSEGNSCTGKDHPRCESSSRTRAAAKKNSTKEQSSERNKSASRTHAVSEIVTVVGQSSFHAESSSSPTSGLVQTSPIEDGNMVASGTNSDLPTPSTSADPQNVRELTHRRPTQDIMQTFTDHIGGVPTQGESFCCCPKRAHCKDLQCTCGEEDNTFEWTWDCNCKSSAAEVSENGREARFHINYSSGTAAVRGSEPMTDGQYFWEIKMITPVYGTDMMVGVGTASVDPDAFQYNFCSLLGKDGESWGLSYYGKAQHKGQFTNIYGARFGQGSIIGMHLDMWQGTLSFYKNRQPLGIIFSGLRGKTLYPMVSSTAARTGMKLVKACSYATSLEFLCCQVLRKMVPLHLDVTTALSMPPGLHEFFLVNNLFWLLRSNKFAIPNMEAGKKRPYPFSEEGGENHEEAECGAKRCRIL